MKPRYKKIIGIGFLLLMGFFLLICTVGVTVQAAGLVDDTINLHNEYSKYPVDNYQLDYYVDSSWDWLPWNWGDGIGKSVMYGIYAITNFFWIISVYLSNATGYLIGEAYSLDFIKDTTQAIGENIQTLAGVSEKGFSTTGFYPGLMLLLVLVLGIYVTYTGVLKREVTKAVSAVIQFVVIFLLSSSFIAYSTSYISKINEFSSDMSQAALDIGASLTMPGKKNESKESVDAIRDALFTIQVKQPWMILEFGDADLETVDEDRVEEILAASPYENKGKTRTELVKKEINDKDNENMTITKTVPRLGGTVFIFFFNLLITVFVFILTGIMIFSQVLFIIYAIFLPLSFLLAMIPSFQHMMKTTIMRLFNVIMMRAGITLILTISFCLSSMVYNLTAGKPFFVIAFLQIVIFAGIYFKLNDLMKMMALNSADSQQTGSRMMRRPKQTMQRSFRKLALGNLAANGLRSIGKGRKDKQGKGKSKPTSVEPKNGQEQKRKPVEQRKIAEPTAKQLETKSTQNKETKKTNEESRQKEPSKKQKTEKKKEVRQRKNSQPKQNSSTSRKPKRNQREAAPKLSPKKPSSRLSPIKEQENRSSYRNRKKAVPRKFDSPIKDTTKSITGGKIR